MYPIIAQGKHRNSVTLLRTIAGLFMQEIRGILEPKKTHMHWRDSYCRDRPAVRSAGTIGCRWSDLPEKGAHRGRLPLALGFITHADHEGRAG